MQIQQTPSEISFASSKDAINKPFFIRQPESKEIEEGQSTVIYVSVDGQPSPKITWVKDEHALQENERVRIRSHGQQHRIEIDNAKFVDAGIYKVHAQNSNGKALATFRVDITVRREPNKYMIQEDARSVSSRSSRKDKGPMLLQNLSGKSKLDGSYRLECSVIDASMVSEVIWYRDDFRIGKYDDKYVMSEKAGIYSLVISGLSAKDAGTYACHLTGIKGGQTTTQFTFSREQAEDHIKSMKQIKSKNGGYTPATRISLPHSSRVSTRAYSDTASVQSENSAKLEQQQQALMGSMAGLTVPVLEPLPGDVEVAMGRALSLTTSWKGETSNVTWYVNGMEVEECDRVRIDTLGNTTTLSILSCMPDDAGMYRVTIQNNYGSDSSEAIATVL